MMTRLWMQIAGQIVAVTLSSQYCVMAQVVPDQTLPVGEQSLVSGDQIDGGAIRGSNLFHSFQQFTIPTGGTASFNNPANIANIITRITGSNPSTIDGLLRSSGTANLFLINPNGILFGKNARLEIGGSFLASTANSVKFADGFEFDATVQSSPLLTISAPIGLQYRSNNPGTIQMQADRLQVPTGQTLILAGGRINVNNAEFYAQGGRLELAGIAAPGEIGLTQQGQEWQLNVPDGLTRADIVMENNGSANVRSVRGGSIIITARNFTIAGQGSRLRAGTFPGLLAEGTRSGDVNINATETVTIDSGFINNLVLPTSAGDAGNINITADTLSISNGGGLSTQTQAIGQSGDININVRILSITNAGLVSSVSFGRGNAGNINIMARDAVFIDGVDLVNGDPTAASGPVSAVAPGAIGNSGNISINTGLLSITNGGFIFASTFGRGNAGNINITASKAVLINGIGSNGVHGGAFSRVEAGAIGRGGRIRIQTGAFSITNQGELSTSSDGQGDAGDLEVNARQLRLEGQGKIVAQTASGQGGNIALQVQELLLLRQGSSISTTAGTAQTSGDGGNIIVNSNFIVAVPEENSNITANAFSGRGGNIRITTQGLFGIEPRSRNTGSSSITASSEFGISGNITLNTPDVDPSQGTATLPTGVIDINALIASSCIARRSRQGRFVITGTGGLAPQPDDLATVDFPTYEIVPEKLLQSSGTEADRIYRTSTGEVVLGRSCE